MIMRIRNIKSLSQYIDVLIKKGKFEFVEDWIDISDDMLYEMKFKRGHILRFRKKVNEYSNK